MTRRSLIAIAACSLAFGANSITGPVAGYLVSSSGKELRAIRGVPGAMGFSAPLPLPEGITRLRLAPGQAYALVERGEESPGILLLGGGGVERLAVLDGAMAEADWISFSPTARSAVWFSAKSARLQLVTGLPDEPSVQEPIDTAPFPEPIYSAAVSDDGTVLLAASIQAVWTVQPDRGVRMALSVGEVRSLAMMRDGRSAIAVDGSTGTVYKLQDVNGSPVPSVLASGLTGIGNVMVSSNGESLIVTQPADRTITILEFESGRTRVYPTDDRPVVLQALRNRDTFLISARPRQAGWIFYLDGEDGRTAFVPASQSSTDREQ